MTETAPYEVTGHLGKVELRRYPALRVAQASGMYSNEAFWHLFRYITGNNRVRKKIAMTAPVISSDTIAMTAPVITSSMTETIPVVSDVGTMSFVLPSNYATEDPPEPLDPVVRTGTIPERDVAVIQFTGTAGHKEIEDETATLLLILEESGVRPIGQPFLMHYDPPMVPGVLRRNEIGIQIPRR
jgi:hypothetical protein